jgi:hypothetical protein
MINTDRVVPVMATDLISLYAVILKQDSNNSGLAKLAASAPGEFTQSTNSAVAIAAEPVTKLDFAAAATAGTVYFVPSLDFKGFSLAGVDTDYTGTIDENGLGSDLYKVVLSTGTLTVTKIGF